MSALEPLFLSRVPPTCDNIMEMYKIRKDTSCDKYLWYQNPASNYVCYCMALKFKK